MKKVMVAAFAVGMLVSGALAEEAQGVYSGSHQDAAAKAMEDAAQEVVSGFMENATITVGGGWAQTDHIGSVGFSLDLSSDTSKEVYSKIGAEISERYFVVSDIVALNLDDMVNPYLGLGYLRAEGVATSGGGCAPGGMFNGTCLPESSIPQTSETIKEKGGFGVVGLSEQFMADGISIGVQIGYRLGRIEGPAVEMALSKKVSLEDGIKAIGMKVNFDQIKNDKEDINRFAVYGTLSF